MLVLSRKRDERIVIGDNVEICIVDIVGDKVSIGIVAPPTVNIARKELLDRHPTRPKLAPTR